MGILFLTTGTTLLISEIQDPTIIPAWTALDHKCENPSRKQSREEPMKHHSGPLYIPEAHILLT